MRTVAPPGMLSPANLRLPAVQYAGNLEKLGFSSLGARQLLAGELLAAPADRQLLARLLPQWLTGSQRSQKVALLLPAVQFVHAEGREPPAEQQKEKITIHASYSLELRKSGLSTLGAQQVLTGMPVTSAPDRASLTDILIGLLR
jgi:hypothetical protein